MQHIEPPDPDSPRLVLDGPLHVEPTLALSDDEKPERMVAITHWQPDEGERKAISNGAGLEVHTLGDPLDLERPAAEQLPTLKLHALVVGEPPEGGERLFSSGQINRALGALFASMVGVSHGIEYMDNLGIVRVLPADEFITRWEKALDETAEAFSDGPSIADMALPSDVRGDLQ